MHPILWKIGPICVYSYGAMVALAVLVCGFLSMRQAQSQGLDKDKIVDLIFFMAVWGIVGGRIFYVLLNFADYQNAMIEIVKIYKGGLVFHGSLIGGSIAAVIFLKTNRMPVFKTLDILALYLPLGHAIGRIGCFLNGCCYGQVTDSFLGVRFPESALRIHPTQLYESGLLLIAFLFLRQISGRRQFPGQVMCAYFMIYGAIRFFMEFLRGDNPSLYLGMSIFQFISLALFFSGAVLYFRFKNQNGKT